MVNDRCQALVNRFFRYVQIDTQSNPASTTQPSSDKQLDLSRLLVTELIELGLPLIQQCGIETVITRILARGAMRASRRDVLHEKFGGMNRRNGIKRLSTKRRTERTVREQ